ncbi:MAG: hypothetical protein OIN89_02565 [Candidatus Methanoperedens sp.]|jgi:hypothetical protein|nr:hypothetical protein [Candidatus Methanoperedens sp.]PKL54274.1 MAG: hypothetical protein CVV36_02525 [Candidatus Methanoperedenaceae archaeon HGW-Methanoperedenaceae-1]
MTLGTGIPRKTVLLSIALLAVGMYFLPATLSIFSGQHTFVNGSDVNCRKCHEDIYQQLNPSYGDTPHRSLTTCNVCHRTGFQPGGFPGATPGFLGYKEVNVSADYNAHSAITLECVFCHDLITNEITGSDEAHGSYYNASNQSTILKGGNEACVGCHTHTTVNITWVRNTGYGMDVDILSGTWNMSFSLNETTVNTTSAGQ